MRALGMGYQAASGTVTGTAIAIVFVAAYAIVY